MYTISLMTLMLLVWQSKSIWPSKRHAPQMPQQLSKFWAVAKQSQQFCTSNVTYIETKYKHITIVEVISCQLTVTIRFSKVRLSNRIRGLVGMLVPQHGYRYAVRCPCCNQWDKCRTSRDRFKFWEISDNISLMVQDRDIVPLTSYSYIKSFVLCSTTQKGFDINYAWHIIINWPYSVKLC